MVQVGTLQVRKTETFLADLGVTVLLDMGLGGTDVLPVRFRINSATEDQKGLVQYVVGPEGVTVEWYVSGGSLGYSMSSPVEVGRDDGTPISFFFAATRMGEKWFVVFTIYSGT